MRDLSSMETRRPSSNLDRDMAFGQRMMLVTTPDADVKEDRDFILESGFSIAYRRRRFPLDRYGEVSIRNSRASGAKTERQKLLDGECKAHLFVWEFTDGWIVCQTSDVLEALRANAGYVQQNNDGVTSAYYIPFRNIPHWRIEKSNG